ncbi:MAG: Maf family protein [Desulfocapsaceae bacterium]|nr:Maf family protein [Desulfocapsaceae bacterium]
MFTTLAEIILASASPRRQNFLHSLGIKFEIAIPEVDETPRNGEPPVSYVERMAKIKNDAVRQIYSDAWIMSADTIVFIDNVILGKPCSEQEAVDTLMYLRGKTHNVATAFCLSSANRQIMHQETVITKVDFANFSKESARAYVITGESSDKAGSYGIQGIGGFLVKSLQGSYSNVVGLPLTEVVEAFTKYGIVKTK